MSGKATTADGLVAPHGGALRNLVADASKAAALKKEALALPSWDLTARQVCDIEMLLNGAFSPLAGFLGEQSYLRVCKEMRLASGALWPMPITLDVTEEFSSKLTKGQKIALRHPEGMVLAVMTVGDMWKPDREQEALRVFGTKDTLHPGVFTLLKQSNPVYLGGPIEGIELPPQYTFNELRHTPTELRALFQKRGWRNIVAFQTRNPMHRAHVTLTQRALEVSKADALLLHPVVGMTKPGDVDYFSRVRCYQAIMPYYPEQRRALSLLPLAMRMGGPREALWHAIIRKNYGANHFIVGRDHAGPGNDSTGKPFYGPYDAQTLTQKHQAELGMTIHMFEEMVYLENQKTYVPRSEVPTGAKIGNVSGTELRNLLNSGGDIPEWFSYKEVVQELRRTYPPKAAQGFTVFFTGLPSSGKSTVANALLAKLMERSGRPVTLLDGDHVRKMLSSELGFSKEHRDLNIRRIGYVASEITKHRGIAICAPIAPYASIRREVREMIAQYGAFVEVYVSTPVEVCETRDRKGLYAKARAGLMKGFTGVDDPYEVPEKPEITLDTSKLHVKDSVQKVVDYLKAQGLLEA
ncbi:MAG: bifunctional sulfate adenylyltransferase/adenylylsulfate kinase [Chloroflexi bacterium]|nr:bifunctional sulfate adenylyltransferase/adenylylsulfate kinase [Chloroflexota bacterium]